MDKNSNKTPRYCVIQAPNKTPLQNGLEKKTLPFLNNGVLFIQKLQDLLLPFAGVCFSSSPAISSNSERPCWAASGTEGCSGRSRKRLPEPNFFTSASGHHSFQVPDSLKDFNFFQATNNYSIYIRCLYPSPRVQR